MHSTTRSALGCLLNGRIRSPAGRREPPEFARVTNRAAATRRYLAAVVSHLVPTPGQPQTGSADSQALRRYRLMQPKLGERPSPRKVLRERVGHKSSRCHLTSALSGRARAVARRRGRDNFRGARGAHHQAFHGPLERIVRQHCGSPGDEVTTGYGVDGQTRYGTPVRRMPTAREREGEETMATAGRPQPGSCCAWDWALGPAIHCRVLRATK